MSHLKITHRLSLPVVQPRVHVLVLWHQQISQTWQEATGRIHLKARWGSCIQHTVPRGSIQRGDGRCLPLRNIRKNLDDGCDTSFSGSQLSARFPIVLPGKSTLVLIVYCTAPNSTAYQLLSNQCMSVTLKEGCSNNCQLFSVGNLCPQQPFSFFTCQRW